MDVMNLRTQLETHEQRFNGNILSMKNLLEILDQKLKEVKNEEDELSLRFQRSKEQIESLENTISKLTNEVNELETKIKNQQEIQNQQEETLSKLRTAIDDLETRKTNYQNAITALKADISTMKQQLDQKRSARETLLANLDKEVEEVTFKLEEAKKKLQSLAEEYSGMDYLMSSDLMQTPEVEILAIVAAQRPVSSEAIKDQVKSVSAVLVTRTITKLEADGMIVSKDGLWDLSDDLIKKVGQ